MAVMALVTSASFGANVAPGDRDYPQSNPHPTKFLLVHGTIDEALDVRFSVAWRANNPQCQYAVSRMAGAYNNYTASYALEIAREGTRFTSRIAIDGVLPGRCQWRFAGVNFGGRAGAMTTLIATNSYPLKAGQSPNGVVELRCASSSRNAPGFPGPSLDCRWPPQEDPGASVRGGTLWWHPEASDLEVHISADPEG